MGAPLVDVEGARLLRATMRKAGLDLADLSDTHRRVATIVAGATRPPVLTGRLASTVRPGATRTMALVRVGSARVPYAGVQEFGWPARNIPAQPFATVAAEATEPAWSAAYSAAVETILARVRGDL